MIKKTLKITLAGALCAMALLAGGCSCSEPRPPKEQTVVSKVEELIPEQIELAGRNDDGSYTFRSKLRDLTFEVKPTADTLTIDGSVFGYSGDFNYKNNYWEKVYGLYTDRVEQLVADHGFKIERRSRDHSYISGFTIAAYNWLSEKNLDNINGFYRDLREIAKEEEKYHDTQSDFNYDVTFLWVDKWNDETSYIRTAGNDNYSTMIKADTPDDELDIRKLKMTDYRTDRVSPPIRFGLLIIIEEDIV